QGACLQQILPAERRETAADERDVACSVIRIHFSQAVAQPDACCRSQGLLGTAALISDAALLQQARDGVKALRAARHDRDQEVGFIQVRQRIEYLFFFAFACAGRKEHPARGETRPEASSKLQVLRAWRAVELEIAADGHLLAAQSSQSLRVGAGLCGD